MTASSDNIGASCVKCRRREPTTLLLALQVATASRTPRPPPRPPNAGTGSTTRSSRRRTACPAAPIPDAPLLTEAQMQHETHWRAERGTSCYRSGRCRLPNAYLYDKEIVPRVVKAIDAAGQFADTSVWVEGQRRWVWLKGCVSTKEQAAELERIVRLVDDVEAVIPQLIVGTTMPPGHPSTACRPDPAPARRARSRLPSSPARCCRRSGPPRSPPMAMFSSRNCGRRMARRAPRPRRRRPAAGSVSVSTPSMPKVMSRSVHSIW